VSRWLLVEEEVELRRKQAERERIERLENMKRQMLAANEEQKRIRERLAREADERERQLTEEFLKKCRSQDERERAAQRARDQVCGRDGCSLWRRGAAGAACACLCPLA
jgi:hypothetical protein